MLIYKTFITTDSTHRQHLNTRIQEPIFGLKTRKHQHTTCTKYTDNDKDLLITIINHTHTVIYAISARDLPGAEQWSP